MAKNVGSLVLVLVVMAILNGRSCWSCRQRFSENVFLRLSTLEWWMFRMAQPSFLLPLLSVLCIFQRYKHCCWSKSSHRPRCLGLSFKIVFSLENANIYIVCIILLLYQKISVIWYALKINYYKNIQLIKPLLLYIFIIIFYCKSTTVPSHLLFYIRW
jgi:hypothetical protein